MAYREHTEQVFHPATALDGNPLFQKVLERITLLHKVLVRSELGYYFHFWSLIFKRNIFILDKVKKAIIVQIHEM